MSAELFPSQHIPEFEIAAQRAGELALQPKPEMALVGESNIEVVDPPEDEIFLNQIISPSLIHRRETLLTDKILKHFQSINLKLTGDSGEAVRYNERQRSLRLLFMSYGYVERGESGAEAFNSLHRKAEVVSAELSRQTYLDLDTEFENDRTQLVLGSVLKHATINVGLRNNLVQMRKTSLLLLKELGITGQSS